LQRMGYLKHAYRSDMITVDLMDGGWIIFYNETSHTLTST
jgi:hypothetical protein